MADPSLTGDNTVNAVDESGNELESISSYQIQVEEKYLENIRLWLSEEIETAKRDRGDLEDKILENERMYSAEPEIAQKDFPWEGASNLVVPIIATAADSIIARILNSVFGGKQLWVGTAKSANWVSLVDPMEKWLNWAGESVMNMYDICQPWIIGMVKHGTGILKLPWERKLRRVRMVDNTGAMVDEIITTHDGPKPYYVPLIDFFFSSDAIVAKDLQSCEWVGHRTTYTWKQIKELETSGIWVDVDRIKSAKRSTATEVEEQAEEQAGVTPSERNDWEVFEIWCSVDVEGEGVLSELVIDFEPETKTILRAVYNFYMHQERPFHTIRYMPRDNSFLGIGICEMLSDIQEEITGVHNRRLDNATIANTRAWKRRRGTNIEEQEVYPGAFIDVDELDDISELRLGDVYPSLLMEEQHTNAIGERRTGVSDYTFGRESSAIGSRATATSTLAIIREGNKRFSMTIRDVREALKNIGHQVIMLYQQFASEGQVEYELFNEKEKAIVKQYLQLPPGNTRNNIYIDIPALSEVNNKEIQQQTMLTLLQVVQKFYMSLFQAVGVAISPQSPEQLKLLAAQGAQSGSKIFERLLESFDFKDADSFVPDIDTMLGLGSTLEQMMGGMTNGVPQGQQVPNGPGGANGSSQDLSIGQVMGAGFEGSVSPVGGVQQSTPF
jgi:hypothetical protein